MTWPLGRKVDAYWPATSGIISRPGYRYRAWIPPFIADAVPALSGSSLVSLTEAEAALAALVLQPVYGAVNLADALIRIEAVSSSRIEGLKLSHRALALTLAELPGRSSTAVAVAHNVTAMIEAIDQSAKGSFSVELIQSVHATLCSGTQLDDIAGIIRDTQNWIGKSGTGPQPGDYVPPPPELVHDLLADLCDFANRSDMPAVFQAAAVHAQFELIHPFADGNGRVGRCLVQAVLANRGATSDNRPPISAILATDIPAYVSGLGLYREGDINGYVEAFSKATIGAVVRVQSVQEAVSTLREDWLDRLNNPRRGSLLRRSLEVLPKNPVLNASSLSMALNTDTLQAIRVLNALGTAGILTPVKSGKRNRVWIASEVTEIYDTFDYVIANAGQTIKPAPSQPMGKRLSNPPAARTPDDHPEPDPQPPHHGFGKGLR